MKTLTEFIRELEEAVSTLVVIGERTHWIFTNEDVIDENWSDTFEVVEIVSEITISVIVKVKYIYED